MSLNITFFDKVKYTSLDFLNRDADFLGSGVVTTSDFPLTYSSPASMTVSVGEGTAWTNGYRVHNDTSTVSLTFATADTTNPRIDIIEVGYTSSTDANGDVTGNASLQIKQGIAAASPIEPSADNGFVKLYAVNIGANQTMVTSLDVLDRRALVPLKVDGSQITNVSGAQQSYVNALMADLYGSTAFVLSGGVATKDGTVASQLDVTAADVYFGNGLRVAFATSQNGQFTTSTPSTTYYLDYNTDGTASFATSHSIKTGYVSIAQVTTDASGNILTVTDVRPTTINLLSTAIGKINNLQANTMVASNITSSFPQLLHPSAQNFTRATQAGRLNGQQVAANVLRLEQGKFRHAPFIEESTTNLVTNSGFETVTGTAQVFSDGLTEYTGTGVTTTEGPWTVDGGSFNFSASGAESTNSSGSLMTAGNQNWQPLTGTNGSALTVVAQATITTPTTLSTGSSNGIVALVQSGNNYYEAFIGAAASDPPFALWKVVGGTFSQLASVSPSTAVTANTVYTITLSINSLGNLVANLYSGVNANGALLATASVTDTSLTGGFLIGVGGDAGVIITSAIVTAPFADGWGVGNDSGIGAWSLSSDAVGGSNYAINVTSPTGSTTSWVGTSNYSTVTSSTTYTATAYVKVANGGNVLGSVRMIEYDGATLVQDSQTQASVSTTNDGWTRISWTFTTQATTNAVSFRVELTTSTGGSGSVTFDAVQLEQKAYATTYIENDSATPGSTATRNADYLSYTLENPLPSSWSGVFTWTPQISSADANPPTDFYILSGVDSTGTLVYALHYKQSINTMRFQKIVGGVTYSADITPISFNHSDKVFLVIQDDSASGITLWCSVNGGPIQMATSAYIGSVVYPVSTLLVGCYDVAGYEADGAIEALITPALLSADQVTALAQASDWGLGDYPSALPDKVQVGTTGYMRQTTAFGIGDQTRGASLESQESHLATNAYYDGSNWQRIDITKPATLMFPQSVTGIALLSYAPAGANPISWITYQLAQVLSGGYKVQSGTSSATVATAGTQIQVPITFPVAFTSAPLVFAVPTSVSANNATYINALADNFTATASGVTVDVNSGTAQTVYFKWVAIGT